MIGAKMNKNRGASHYDYVFLFKVLIIQKFYGLLDEQTEYQIFGEGRHY